MNRQEAATAEIDPLFLDRWSPRAFRSEPVSSEQIASLFEAMRWAPSSSNEQPWVVVYAQTQADRERFLGTLVEGNRIWAKHAPLLLYIAARRHSRQHPERLSPTATFDTGAAWMALALQARRLGLYAHAMAGFDKEAAYPALSLDVNRYELCAAVAVGGRGDTSLLPPKLQEREAPNGREAVVTFVHEGSFRPEAPTSTQ